MKWDKNKKRKIHDEKIWLEYTLPCKKNDTYQKVIIIKQVAGMLPTYWG